MRCVPTYILQVQQQVLLTKTEATADTSLLTQFDLGTATYSYYRLSAPDWGYLHGTNSIHLQGFARNTISAVMTLT
jgi:hypothetical protein